MTDAADQRLWMGDLPVREIPDSIASLASHPRTDEFSQGQKVALVYASAIARVLKEQSELYIELLWYLEGEGASFPLLREIALDRARIISELWLSARREDVDISEEAPPGMNPLGALLALEAIKRSDVVLAGEDPDPALLITPDLVDTLVRNPYMDPWWATILPRGEDPPPRFGTGNRFVPPASDRALARGAVILLADCLEESVLDYHGLLNGGLASTDTEAVRAAALRRALEINRRLHADFVLNLDFSALDEALDPVSASFVLKLIGDSCTVFAAPKGDFERYGTTADELEEVLADPELRAWLDAVEAMA